MDIIPPLLQFRNQIKLYHWKTPNAIRHIISDNFLKKIDSLIDKFVEVYLGSREMKADDSFSIVFKSKTDITIMKYMDDFKTWLVYELPPLLFEYEVDLLNLRDEMLGEVNRCLYLFQKK
jgi:hypothetical protein